MQPLYSTSITTDFGEKEIAVFDCNILDFDKEVDILTTSAFVLGYFPTPGTLYDALNMIGISVMKLSASPYLDLRKPCSVWLSKDTLNPRFKRIGCVELLKYNPFFHGDTPDISDGIINSIRAYFYMLDIAAAYNVKMDTIALPVLGSGNQSLPTELMIVPLLNECISFLKRNSSVKRIYFIERDSYKASVVAEYLKVSYNIRKQKKTDGVLLSEDSDRKPKAFISYASGDRNIADNLCAKLEQRGVPVWYAPRNVQGAYAESIALAIEDATHFIVILSENSMKSQHVLNEIDLAFQKLPNNIKFKPLKIDESLFTPSFRYYISRQHWMDAVDPPLEDRLNDFVELVLRDM